MTFTSSDHRGVQAEQARIAAHIERFGLSVISVGGAECQVPGCQCEPSDEQWTYSVGRVERGLPELVVTGLAPRLAAHLVNAVDGLGSVALDEVTWIGPIAFVLRAVPATWLEVEPGRVGGWLRHYDCWAGSIEAMPDLVQIVWGDADGRMPGDPECDAFVAEFQPVLADDPFAFPALSQDIPRPRRTAHPGRHRRAA